MNFKKFKSSIMFKAFLNENGRTKITVKIDDPPSQVLVDLNVNDNLSNIREELRKNDMIEMNDALSFAKKEPDGLSEIGVDEKSINLDVILDGNVLHLIKSSKCNWKFLNVKFHLEYGLSITPNGIKKAKKKAFTIKDWKDCKMTKIGAKGCQKGTFEYNSNEYWGMKSNLLFSGNINVRDLVNLGVSVGKSQNNNVNVEMNSTYSYREFGKVSLEFSKCLVPTSDFINIVEKAIESGDPNELKQIIEEYGQFIPDEVILGGRFYFEGTQTSKKLTEEKDYESVVKVGIQQALDIGVGNRSENSKGNTNSCKRECTKLIGGEQPDSLEEFDETAWVRSLKDFRNWDCIEYKNLISIFQILPDDSRDLHGRIFSLIGKKIHYSRIEDFTYNLEEFEKPKVLKLDIPPKISKIVQNKKTDCNIFATVLDTDENDDFFNYQIFHPPKGNPSLIIHCIQNKLRKRECKLKIGWMIVGYHTDFNSIFTDSNIQLKVLESDFNASKQSMDDKKFLEFEYNSLIEKIPCLGIPVLSKLDSSNESIVIGHHFFNVKENNKIGSYTFSYCFKHNHYVNLPDFTFYTLIISKYSNPDDYGMSSFTKSNFNGKISSFSSKSFKAKINKMIKSKSSNSDSLRQMKLKYVSLHTSGENNCGPIFLKQKSEKIKRYTINISCGQASSCICKNKTLKKSKKNLEYAFFTPKEENRDETET
ncbi:unnamed protein product [Rhizophagus irregularis]|nr:unnamed protein product [Rhizophagus irregularis]CAB5369948.1 unnamed protein product [Rhizophagus irregularis]